MRLGAVASQGDDLLALAQHAPRAHHDFLAHVGELHVVRLALHQLHAQVFLELLQLGRQRRLAHEGALGGLAEMPGVGQCHQILEILEIH